MSESFIDLVDRAAGLFTGPLSDNVAQIVAAMSTRPRRHPAMSPSAGPSLPTGTCAALAGGMEIAEAGGRITGVPLVFVSSTGFRTAVARG